MLTAHLGIFTRHHILSNLEIHLLMFQTKYSGQAWEADGEKSIFIAGNDVPINLVCGCIGESSQLVATYTVQDKDTLSMIADLFSTDIGEIERLNPQMNDTKEGSSFDPPPSKSQQQKQMEADHRNIVSCNATFYRCISNEPFKEKEKPTSERPVVYSLDEIEEATMSFDETRKIGEGGYGCVYHGEVAIKKMKSNKSKEFFAELKVLCKIHHINVVELLGYGSGDDHLYLVYECHQPLSWTARAQIAVDAARGIEYIHDHTKACHVHRDIKTSNILLDKGLRAKVADFGMVKLVERAGEGDIQATRLVGTPGYLPPESVFELETTSKSDVFAFGVVLAELITGQRALIQNNQEPEKMKSLISVVSPLSKDQIKLR
ncbi:hypothetical protein MKW98_027006 [Papaver atlanticum]|uniref:Protein kinase domain-containing protein n=1 Tax=Papaver atlanticum TaxID=357466 RepID=A0AAD4RWR0_9MAGN|nr:hypothetical protein MKW98_027006 [Papaver atlanticum]